MTLSGYVPDLIEEDFMPLVQRALAHNGKTITDIFHWCIHPGGKRILEAIGKSLQLKKSALQESYNVLHDYGNMSSPTILFVLKKIMSRILSNPREDHKKELVFSAAFGPGLTMETFIASH